MRATILPQAVILTKAHRAAVSMMAKGKIVVKVPTRIKHIYERCPYYIGTLLWNELNLLRKPIRYLIFF